MQCLCQQWAHAAYATGCKLYRIANASVEAQAFAQCAGYPESAAQVINSPDGNLLSVAAALYAAPELRNGLIPKAYVDESGKVVAEPPELEALAQLYGVVRGQAVELLVPVAEVRRSSSTVHSTLAPRDLPAGSFLRVGEPGSSLLVPAPELHLLLRARDLCAIDLAVLVSEYCGEYAARPDRLKGMIRRKRTYTSRDKIAAYLDKLPPRTRGASRLRAAVALAFDGGRSPREVKLAVGLSAPPRLGGFGLPRPVLNQPVPLGPAARRLVSGRHELSPDLLWPEASVAVEYDSDQEHANQRQGLVDVNRRAAFEQEGITCIPVTKERVGSYEQFCALARQLDDLLPGRRRTAAPDDLRRETHERLFSYRFVW